MSQYHNPVLLYPAVNALISQSDGIYVDVTFGGGGHSRAILNALSPGGRLLAFDQDPDSAANRLDDERFLFIPYNFKYLKKFLQYHHAYPVNGILADLGVSSFQFDTAERGFSYRFDGALDMRMNRGKGVSARDIVNTYPEQKLADIFYTYGELSNGRRLAQQIVAHRTVQTIETTGDLVTLVSPLFPRQKQNKLLAQLFQALRLEVNGELDVLKEFLLQTTEALQPGGRLVVISYHSLEDRLVKNFMKSGNFDGMIEKDFFGNPNTPFRVLSGKAIVPDEDEIEKNPRARSAKLRVAEKK